MPDQTTDSPLTARWESDHPHILARRGDGALYADPVAEVADRDVAAHIVTLHNQHLIATNGPGGTTALTPCDTIRALGGEDTQ